MTSWLKVQHLNLTLDAVSQDAEVSRHLAHGAGYLTSSLWQLQHAVPEELEVFVIFGAGYWNGWGWDETKEGCVFMISLWSNLALMV